MLGDNTQLKEPETDTIFWTGGFDSTYLLIKLLKQKKRVQPIYLKHSRASGWMKGAREDEARKKIRAALKPAWKKLLKPEIVWDFDQFHLNRNFQHLFNACDELCKALTISPQYAALRAAKDWVDYKGPAIQMAIIMYDALWWNLKDIGTDQPGWSFFAGFEFPTWWEDKMAVWRTASKYERSLLSLTFSCEISKGSKTCIEKGLPMAKRCCPCQGRLPSLV